MADYEIPVERKARVLKIELYRMFHITKSAGRIVKASSLSWMGPDPENNLMPKLLGDYKKKSEKWCFITNAITATLRLWNIPTMIPFIERAGHKSPSAN